MSDTTEYIEVTDDQDRPLVIMPTNEAGRQRLRRRVVLVALYDSRGRLCLQRRSPHKLIHPGCWDLSATGHVRAGESRDEAALRELSEELAVTGVRLRHIATLAASQATANTHVTLFEASGYRGLPIPCTDEVTEVTFTDADELQGLYHPFPRPAHPRPSMGGTARSSLPFRHQKRHHVLMHQTVGGKQRPAEAIGRAVE